MTDRSKPYPTQTALLIIDMFNLFDFEHGAALAKAACRRVRAIAGLRARFDAAGAPVIYVNDNFSHWQGEFKDLVAQCALACGAPAAITSILAPGSGHYYILKPKHSAFLATALPVLLAKLGVRRLVLTGISTDSCILATAQDATMREYSLWCPSDAMAAINRARHASALKVMKSSVGAAVSSTRQVPGLFPEATR
jgi:nicotinamidase-related amidase